MCKPLISVVIPAYNVELYIEEAIQSIIKQTYRNLEIIVVDDASTDKTYNILQKLADNDKRIKLYRNSSNLKITETLNFGISQATGNFIARMDGDDISLPTRIEEQYNFLIKNTNIDIVGVNLIYIDQYGNKISYEEKIVNHYDIKKAIKYISPLSHVWLTSRRIYEILGPYRIPTAEDLDFLLRALDYGFKLNNIPKFLYLCRLRSGNTLSVKGLVQRNSISYCRKLHDERINNSSITDSFSIENLEIALRSNWIEEQFFQISSKFHLLYFTTKSSAPISAALYRILSVIFFPTYQLKLVYNRWRYNRILKLNNSINS